MSTLSQDFEGSNKAFARSAKTGVAAAAVVAALLVGATWGDGSSEAAARIQTDDGYLTGYFPAQFPAPAGPIEPHIEAF